MLLTIFYISHESDVKLFYYVLLTIALRVSVNITLYKIINNQFNHEFIISKLW